MEQSTSNAKRARERPAWFGNRASSSALNISDEVTDPFEDNSYEDDLYVPEKKKKKLPKLLRSSFPTTVNAVSIPTVDLNDEFDQIRRSESDKMSACTRTAVGENYEENLAHYSVKSLAETNNSNYALEKGASYNGSAEDESNVISKSPAVDMELLSSLHRNSVEILARITVIEESLIKNKILNTLKSKNLFNGELMKHANAFMQSNNLPFNRMEDLQAFETKLQSEEFKQVAVSFPINLIHNSNHTYRVHIIMYSL